jgi:hypothetical protein
LTRKANHTNGAGELIAELARRQQPNGSWVNTDRKWMESDPNLVTGFSGS